MKKTLLGVLLFCSFLPLKTRAQTPVTEKIIDASAEARKGFLGNVEMNKEKGTADVIYIMPSATPGKVKFETTSYDKDMNPGATASGEEEISKLRSKWGWLNYTEDSYFANKILVQTELRGDLIFRKKETQYSFQWKTGTYTVKKNKISTDAIKPSPGGTMKYLARGGCYDNKSNNSVLALGAKVEGKKFAHFSKAYDIVRVDNTGNSSVTGSIDFGFNNAPIFSGTLTDDKNNVSEVDHPHDWIVVFAPEGALKSERDPKANNCLYVRISPEGKIIEKFNFDSPSNGWRIVEAHEANGSVYLYGQAITSDPAKKYFDQTLNNGFAVPTTNASEAELRRTMELAIREKGALVAMTSADAGWSQEHVDQVLNDLEYTHFVIGKITGGKFDFITSTPISDFEKKQAKPASQKKSVGFDGKTFAITGAKFPASGNIYIYGQDFENKKGAAESVTQVYGGLYLFQFDSKGALVKNYGLSVTGQEEFARLGHGGHDFGKLDAGGGKLKKDEGSSLPEEIKTDSYIQESADGKSVYWISQYAKQLFCCGPGGENRCTPVYGYNYSIVNTATGDVTGWAPMAAKDGFNINFKTEHDFNNAGYFFSVNNAENKIYFKNKGSNSDEQGYCDVIKDLNASGDKLIISKVEGVK